MTRHDCLMFALAAASASTALGENVALNKPVAIVAGET